MKPPRRRQPSASATTEGEPAGDPVTILQFRVWLKGLSPMVWRRVQVPSTMTLRELHGVLQVAMGWDGIHLYQFILHTVCYGSWELNAESADIALDDLKLRKGQRFTYEYDLNIPWEHEVRLEERHPLKPGTHYPCCIGGGESCPPEDSGGPDTWMWQRDEALGLELSEDLAMALEFMTEINETRSLAILADPSKGRVGGSAFADQGAFGPYGPAIRPKSRQHAAEAARASRPHVPADVANLSSRPSPERRSAARRAASSPR
ncbi:plasmid pRiA4b ORF-3 family protein [Ochrobactrum sp. BTU2]|uniref:plasmid pRiA4b ORF-3 family protein n=1 Tax=Ochrobactrum sp. BTU2 TaxID=2856166 RepID=UPI002119CAA2|nr:plasmid pRiA4b ORF-3 family protein [Ochrobactrum sp. BTU2]